jgi:hypothetical protein
MANTHCASLSIGCDKIPNNLNMYGFKPMAIITANTTAYINAIKTV